MGFFSFKTQDTNKSVSNHQSSKGTFTVFMHDNRGNVYREDNYKGFGEFSGKDYYELLAEMNGKKTRLEGIDIAYSGKPYLAPNITECEIWTYKNEAPERCEDQGFFYN